ncbi:MAG: aromatic ring-hydroxylating dioxygenase subunit alpha [Rhodospirillaceae bacterium]|mgnify:CR=1 FL=1|jgi:vanillate O-demethylase monooxygenase subunit|nr:aromatic ring-hydroxylating dioxygenase subunit alpha [Rhodospirillaceae bacterium]MBT3885251.1 aromatic ring-hydroxylating dioxygenase subunit alpha [Rhodospirillaceae bacterium]MBT4115703.1 aromatic ring-hydroxylating dioxygenase subunit alpha [Rhodospirillaceae bacterium]MBT4673402.1 aromatic ring-hydroxylating dioxygenase subunit alpha [Rhodospirillaceae bacterium]MBT4721819.1 aromatic ring-hydroxylating dioxygenase subunit alpha [Rhodospirillaceae bacterium]
MWIRNAWYIAGWASEVSSDHLLARTFLGEPVIMYRAENGSVAALEDRCCHRHAPLSKGRLEGDAVRCMYHGLKFDPSGQCIEIPGETNVPANYRVRGYPLTEKQNLLWIWMGDTDLADPSDIVDWPYLDDEAWRFTEGYLHYQASYLLGIDNFLDFSHLPYVHEHTIGTDAFAQNRPATERTDYGMHIRNIATNDPPSAHFKKFGGFRGLVDRWNIYNFHTRGNLLLMDSGAAPVGEGGHEGERKNACEFRHLSAMTPETETTSHYHFGHARNFGLDVDGLDQGVHDTIVNAFEEDRDIIDAQQRIISGGGTAPMLPIAADAALLHIRREIDNIVAKEQQLRTAAE